MSIKCLLFLLSVSFFACTMPESQLKTTGSIDQDNPGTRGVIHTYSLPCWHTQLISQKWTITVVGNQLYYEYGGSAAPDIAHEFQIKINGISQAWYYKGMTPYTRKGWFYARTGDELEISMKAFRYCYSSGSCYDWVFGIITVKDIPF